MTCEEFIKANSQKKQYFVEALKTPIEKGKQFSIVLPKGNNEKFIRILIDKGLLAEIDLETLKCDYGFIRCNNSDYYFVELKGVDIEHAYKQITTTIKYFKEKYNITSEKTYAFIASSGVPKADLKFNKLIEDFKKKKIGVSIKKQTNHCFHNI